MGKLAIAVCFASAAFGQNVDRVFHPTTAMSAQTWQEIATTIRTVAQIQQLSLDLPGATLTVKGTPDQMALAEWLVPKLDEAAGSNPGPRDYWVSRNSDDVVLVFELAHTSTPQGAQEIITSLRTIADIQKIFLVTAHGIMALRGNASQIALARFLLPELDQAPVVARQSALVHVFTMTGGGNDTVLVYGLTHTDTPRDFQEIITNLRTVLSIQRIFQVTAPKLLALRASASEVQMSEWLIPELDRQTANAGGNEARVPGGDDDVVHVFYLSHLTTAEGMNGVMREMRATAHISRAFVRTSPAALVLRGTADQIAMAGRMIELSDHAAP
ncbi:MAG: hypothetical protein ACR2I2_13470 [Bryobacteraceae bacterium]